jgi:hypothetical protein
MASSDYLPADGEVAAHATEGLGDDTGQPEAAEEHQAVGDIDWEPSLFGLEGWEWLLDQFPPLSSVTERSVGWLWRGRIPMGKLTVVDGDPGVGKSFVLMDLIARITTGRPMPGEDDSRAPRSVLLMAAEDDQADTILPRLRACGGAADLLRVIPGGKLSLPSGLEFLDMLLKEDAAAVVVIDPLSSYLDATVNPNNGSEVRRALGTLQRVAESREVAVLLVRHRRKQGGKAMYAGLGAIDISAVVRSILAITSEPSTGRRLLEVVKASLTASPPTLGFDIVTDTNGTASVQWTGPVIETAPSSEHEAASALAEASAFLQEELRDGSIYTAELNRRAAAASIKPRTLRRAKDKLGVVTRRGSRLPDSELRGRAPDRWYCQLPPLEGDEAPHE